MKNTIFGAILGVSLSVIAVLTFLLVHLGNTVSQDHNILGQVVTFLQKTNSAPAATATPATK